MNEYLSSVRDFFRIHAYSNSALTLALTNYHQRWNKVRISNAAGK